MTKKTFNWLFLIVCAMALFTGCVAKPATDLLECDAATITHFPYKANGVEVTKHQTCTPIENIPGLVKIETFYVNEGKPITVRAYEMCRTEVEANDSVVWSLQPSSTNGRLDWVLPVTEGFKKENFLGMNNSDYGGGIPMVDLWQKDGGVAIGLIEPVLRMISMPIEWKRYDNKVSMALRYEFPCPVELNTGDTLYTYTAFRLEHKGDYFNALRTFSEMMQQEAGIVLPESEPEAFEPVWCAWGYERTFTIKEVIGTLDKVAELGFKWVDVDDGFQIAEGDWETNCRFPGGDKDMRRMTDEIHRRGMYAKLWWAPLAADPGTNLLKKHPEMMLLTDEWTPEYISWWDSYYLSPVNPHTTEHTNMLLDRFLNKWNFDGLKIDGQHLNCCEPDHNEHSGLEYPAQAVELMPTYFQNVYEQSRAIHPHAVIQICPCGCAMNYYHLPYFNQAVASDPTSSKQVRMKRKAYAAMAPQMAYYGDHVELTDGGTDFASQIGTGAVIGSKFTYPKDNPNVQTSYLLTPEKEQLIRHWMKIFKEKNLARGEYMNLYTWGYDYPEAHVIKQNDALYYAFYTDAEAYQGTIELRGLEKGKTYTATTYTAETPVTFLVDGANPVIEADFVGHYLLELKENK
jgi:alpha-galactosidase